MAIGIRCEHVTKIVQLLVGIEEVEHVGVDDNEVRVSVEYPSPGVLCGPEFDGVFTPACWIGLSDMNGGPDKAELLHFCECGVISGVIYGS